MILEHVLVHQDDTRALHATFGAHARAGRGLVLVLLLHVRAEVGRLREAVFAERALKRLLPRVHDHVIQEGLPRDEVLVADAARQHLLSRVEPHVQVEVLLPLERLSAVVALKLQIFLPLFLQMKSDKVYYLFYVQ